MFGINKRSNADIHICQRWMDSVQANLKWNSYWPARLPPMKDLTRCLDAINEGDLRCTCIYLGLRTIYILYVVHMQRQPCPDATVVSLAPAVWSLYCTYYKRLGRFECLWLTFRVRAKGNHTNTYVQITYAGRNVTLRHRPYFFLDGYFFFMGMRSLLL